jgi:prepilin peptidase CpaA
MSFENIIFTLVSLELIVVSIIDFKKKIISNWWSIFHLVLFLISNIFFKSELSIGLFFYPFAFLIIGFVLFLLKIMGAGDSKFLASLSLVLPVKFHPQFLESLLYATILVGFILLMLRLKMDYTKLRAYFLSRYWRGITQAIKSEFSYAPVIFLAWIFTWLKVTKG